MAATATKRLKEARLAVWAQMSDILTAAETEGRSMSGEEMTRFKALEVDLNAQGAEIEARERADGIAATLAQPASTRGAAALQGDPLDGTKAAEDRYHSAFKSYLKRGMHISAEMRDVLDTRDVTSSAEYRDMGEASGAIGGYLVPPGFLSKVTEVLKWYGGVREVANVISTASGQSLVWPANDDTANPAVIIGEDTAVSELDLGFTQRTLSAFLWTTGAVRIGRALMQDSAFDLESLVADRFAKRFGRGENTKYTTGAGITGGLLSGSGFTASGVVGAGAAPFFTFANLVTIMHSLEVAYRKSGSCVWMMNDTTLGQLHQLTDTAGRPIFIPAGSFGSIASGVSTVNGAPGGPVSVDTLLGFPIVVNNDLSSGAATGSALPILFGDFKAGYIVRDVIGSLALLRLEERYADFGEVGFIGYKRSDGNIDDKQAVVTAANHA